MSLKNGKPNPLNYFDLRRVEFAAPHFKYTSVDKYSPQFIKTVDSWIKQTLNNRYYLGQGITLDNANSIVYNTVIGFENERELSFFIIACPHLISR